jgi:succinate-semialdehyde dehydrogenase/glutarate-semialdehyde dehydrogenase
LDRGFFYAPTILSHVNPDMVIYREETFGPVAPIVVYNDKDDLLAMANDTCYGLASYVYTRDLNKAFQLFEGLHFGIVGINDINPTSAEAPFGARVASQRCPVLRAGIRHISLIGDFNLREELLDRHMEDR